MTKAKMLKTEKEAFPEQRKFNQGRTPGRYQVQFDFDYSGTPGKKMDDTLETQPDMTLTVRQLLEHHTRGISPAAQERHPVYFDIEVPTIKDITDVHAYREHLAEKMEQTDQFIKEEKAAAKKAKADAEKAKKEAENASKQLDLEVESKKASK